MIFRAHLPPTRGGFKILKLRNGGGDLGGYTVTYQRGRQNVKKYPGNVLSSKHVFPAVSDDLAFKMLKKGRVDILRLTPAGEADPMKWERTSFSRRAPYLQVKSIGISGLNGPVL